MITVEGIDLFDIKDLSEKLYLSPLTVKRYIRQGKLKAQKIGRKYYVSAENLKLFLSGTTYETPVHPQKRR